MSRREDFLKSLIKDNLIEYCIMFENKDLSDDTIFLLGIKNISNDQYKTLSEKLNDYNNVEILPILLSHNTFEEDVENIKDMENVNEYKVITEDLEVREYNKLLNEEDLKPHDSVGVCILDSNNEKVLVLDHIKFDMITVPVGKVKDGQDIFEALKQEVFEETGIIIKKAKEIAVFDTHAIRNDIKIDIHNHLFIAMSNWVDITNMENKEPKKHRSMFWMDLDELQELETRSFMTIVFQGMFKEKSIEINSPTPTLTVGGVSPCFSLHIDSKTHKFKDIEYIIVTKPISE